MVYYVEGKDFISVDFDELEDAQEFADQFGGVVVEDREWSDDQ